MKIARKGQTISDVVWEQVGVNQKRSRGRKVPRYTEWGCYPLFYLDHDYTPICPDCVNNRAWSDKFITQASVNWETPDLYCENCNKRIESAYAEDTAGAQ